MSSKTVKPLSEVEEKTEEEKEKEIEAEMEIKSDPSTSTLQLAKQDDDAIEEGEIKMVDPSENQPTEDESEKSDFERKVSYGKCMRNIFKLQSTSKLSVAFIFLMRKN